MYKQMSESESVRCRSDMLYDCIVNVHSDQLDNICTEICNIVAQRWEPNVQSTRMKNMMKQTLASDDRVAKHALLFFALYQEPSLQTLFINEVPRVPPEKFAFFLEKELPQTVQKLLKGAFTSLRAFVEDTRWTYTTL